MQWSPPWRGGRASLRLAAALLLLSALAAVPGAAAADVGYDGPGTAGTVPVGDGGAGARNRTGADVTYVQVVGIPADACRVDLEPDLGTGLEWTPNETVALVWADQGLTNAPFRFRGHWLPDLNGACTVEVTPDGLVYHDASGRPFVQLEATLERRSYAVPGGASVLVNITLLNNGTIDDIVNARLKRAPGDWEIRWTQEYRRIPLGAGDRARFPLEVEVPPGARGFASLTIGFVAVDSQVETQVLVVIDVGASVAEQKAVSPTTGAPTPSVYQPPREYVWEAPPVPAPLALLALLSLCAVARAAHSSSSCRREDRRGSP